MSEKGHVPPPSGLAIGICDLLYRDRGTGKRFILGCFSVINAQQFPAKHPALGIYLDLTNGRGDVTVKAQIVDVDKAREPVWVAELNCEFPDPRAVAELDFVVGGLEFPEPGEYRVQAYANDIFVIERRLLVNLLEAKVE